MAFLVGVFEGDFDAFKQQFDSDPLGRRQAAKGHTLMRGVDNPNEIFVRVEFDSAVDLMLQASSNPTNPTLYGRRFEEIVDSIHHYDLSGMGAAVVEAEGQFDKAPLGSNEQAKLAQFCATAPKCTCQ